MKRFSLLAVLIVMVLGANQAQADLLSRMDQIFAHKAQDEGSAYYSPTPAEQEVQVLDGDGQDATEYVISHDGNGYRSHGVYHGHGFGCCDYDPSYAMSLWAGFCGHQHGCRSQRCRKPKCRKARFHSGRPKCCKRQRSFCMPKFDFHWLQGCCRPKRCCRQRLFANWFHNDFCGDNCMGQCDSCASGEVMQEGAEEEIFETPPMPIPQPEKDVKSASVNKSARNWLLPSQFRLLPVSLGR